MRKSQMVPASNSTLELRRDDKGKIWSHIRLLSLPISETPEEFQREVANEREKALAAIAEARKKVAEAAIEVEAIILGTKKIATQ